MKLILRSSVENLGEPGDVVRVKAGYGRNYLIPQGLAYEATDANVRSIEEERAKTEEASKRDYLEARRRASQLEGMSLTFLARAGEDGKLFGSVTGSDIAEHVNEQVDFDMDRRAVVLEEPLKAIGVYAVRVHLHPDVDVELEVRIERESE